MGYTDLDFSIPTETILGPTVEAAEELATKTIFEGGEYLRYPKVKQDEYNAFVEFKLLYVNRPLGDSTTVKGYNDKYINFLPIADTTYSSETRLNNYNISSGGIILYLPSSIMVASGAQYGTVDFGALGTTIEKALQTGGAIDVTTAKVAAGGVKQIVDEFAGAWEAITTNGSQLSKDAIARVANKFLSNEAASAVYSAYQYTINPDTRAVFQNVGLRDFVFSFKMIPKSADEAEEIKKIVKFFRHELHPEAKEYSTDLSWIKAGFEFPNQFKIMMKYAKEDGSVEPIAIKILPSVLVSVNVTYNATSMGMHADGNFMETDMTLTFREVRTLSKQDIRDDY